SGRRGVGVEINSAKIHLMTLGVKERAPVYNVIYLNTHDLGRMIEPYGYPVPTPNLVRLARQGTLLRKAFCAAPTCSPSRAALLTGMAAHSCGMTGLVHRGFSLTEEGKYAHLARFLRDKGYETVLA